MFSAYSELIVYCASSELTIINLKQFGGSGFDDISYRYSPLSTIFSIIRERETRSTTGAVARHAMDIPCNLSSKRKSISQTLHGKATQVYEIYLFFFSSVYPCNRLASLQHNNRSASCIVNETHDRVYLQFACYFVCQQTTTGIAARPNSKSKSTESITISFCIPRQTDCEKFYRNSFFSNV